MVGPEEPVLTPTSSPHFSRNREAHLQRWGIALDAAGGDRIRVDVRDDPSVQPSPGAAWPANQTLSIRVQDGAGAWVKMHSDRAPMAEAEAWWRAQLPATLAAPTVAVVGAGLGYLLEVIERSSEASMLVLEPEPGLVPWLLARRDWTPLIAAGRLLVLPGPSFESASRAWGVLSRAPRAAPATVLHPVTARTHPAAAAAAGRAIGTVMQASRANARARRRFEASYLLNTLANVATLAGAPPVAMLDGRSRGRPVVIAGAGPSLDRNIAELRPYRDAVTLVAADTALVPLLHAGLMPDYVVAVDPGPLNARHLIGAPTDPATVLVAEMSVDPAALEAFAGRVVSFRVADHPPWRWLTRVGIDPGTLRAWGSVITSAFDLALRLGGDPIVFTGADLAYTDGQPYCRHTRYEEDWARAVDREGLSLEDVWDRSTRPGSVLEVDVHGSASRTAPHLISYRDWLAHECAHHAEGGSARRIVYATGAGILHGPGIIQQSLASALEDVAVTHRASAPVSVSPSHRTAMQPDPVDAHLLQCLHRQHAVEMPSMPTPTVTPYMRQTRAERLRSTRQLRSGRDTDTTRWSDPSNLDVAWERRAAVAGQLVPPFARVLDLGAGLEALERYLPDGATYVPADVVSRSERTVVIDLNAGELPTDRYDVVALLGVLEYVHDPLRLLQALTSSADLLVMSYCVVTAGPPQARLQRGWVNDMELSSLLDALQTAGWDVAWAQRIDVLDDFDQWVFACRPSPRR